MPTICWPIWRAALPAFWLRLSLALLGLLWPALAWAHPHVLCDVHALVEFKDGKIVSLFMGWKFDPIFSATLMKDFDKNKNNRLDPAEIKDIEREAFGDTKDQGYFTYARAGDTVISWPQATDFKVMGVKDALLYAFRLTLPQPVDPRKVAFSFTTYEETFYIDMDFPNDAAVTLTGDGSEKCRVTILPDVGNTIFGGVVTPKRASITCD
jgi:tRNA threonylcarbamoyladenosine biosynthesis protein TsaE